MEKKLTNSGPFRESVDKHSIYPWKQQQGASSQYIGVSYHRGRQCWQAYVRVQGRLVRVGEFASEQEAAQARDQRVLALGFSPLVRLNFPGEHERFRARR